MLNTHTPSRATTAQELHCHNCQKFQNNCMLLAPLDAARLSPCRFPALLISATCVSAPLPTAPLLLVLCEDGTKHPVAVSERVAIGGVVVRCFTFRRGLRRSHASRACDTAYALPSWSTMDGEPSCIAQKLAVRSPQLRALNNLGPFARGLNSRSSC